MKKVQIHQFDPVIYPFKLWITITSNYEPIYERFKYDNETRIDYSTMKHQLALADNVRQRENPSYFGAIIIFKNKQSMTLKNIAHECSHATKFLCQHVGLDVSVHEPFEYILGWMVDCCDQVRLNKFK